MLVAASTSGEALVASRCRGYLIPSELRSTGQGLATMIGSSLGGICSNYVAGLLIDHIGPAAPHWFTGGIGER